MPDIDVIFICTEKISDAPKCAKYPCLEFDKVMFCTRLYDKRDDFDFRAIKFTYLSSDIVESPEYGVFMSHLIHYAPVCSIHTYILLSSSLRILLHICQRITIAFVFLL